jgi:hypothetical protein
MDQPPPSRGGVPFRSEDIESCLIREMPLFSFGHRLSLDYDNPPVPITGFLLIQAVDAPIPAFRDTRPFPGRGIIAIAATFVGFSVGIFSAQISTDPSTSCTIPERHRSKYLLRHALSQWRQRARRS